MIWGAVITASVGCYLFKLAGLSVPERVLNNDRVRRVASLLPIALLIALIALQTFSEDEHLTIDARLPALGVAAIAVYLKAPFLVVVGLAAGTAALIRVLS